MSATTWLIIAIVFYIVAIIFGIISVTVFFKLNIRSVWEDISGKKATRGIMEIQASELKENSAHNYKMHNKTDPLVNRGNQLNLNTDAMNEVHPSKRLDIKTEDGTVITAELNETTLLSDSEQTTVLDADSVNLNMQEGTTLLTETMNGENINVSKTFKCTRKMVILQSSERI